MERVFLYHSEPVKREHRSYIEDLGNIFNEEQLSNNSYSLIGKYGGLYLYDSDMEKIYSIDGKGICFVKGDVYALIGDTDHTDGTSTDHEYFSFMMTCLTES